ncbi:MAG TPA: response regulator transcription factor [Vicinamibacterales bacterium]|nr:response regulator transcription factor [Vicinamibacterales bacterium]
MVRVDLITAGRRAYARRAWADAHDALTRASTEAPLDVDDTERLAWAGMLSGRDESSFLALERFYELCLEAGQTLRAARGAIWLGMRLMSIRQIGHATGWLARARRLVEAEGPDCVEQGYLQLPLAFQSAAAGDQDGARAASAAAIDLGDRYADPDLSAFGRTLAGRALIVQGRLSEGLPLLDEAMVAASSGALSPHVTGLVYCFAIAACNQSHALDRAREWTSALSAWCDAQPQLVPFAGACLVHRSEIMLLGGAWSDAIDEARRAAARLAGLKGHELGLAHYQEGEIHRLRGDQAEAERAYTLAREHGRDPHPGLALLRMAQGRVDLAAAATERVLSVTRDPLQRTRFLPAHVEIMLAASEPGKARQAAEELRALAAQFGMNVLGAMAAHADGAVALAEGDARTALNALRRAQDIWQRVGAPYLDARIRVLVARAFRALGDEEGAALELEAARRVFIQLGAAPDVSITDALIAAPTGTVAPARPDPKGLSRRELEVLRLVAMGKTNKVIAGELFVSEKTIDRHVSNIFVKIDVSSRAAATAWAFRHGVAR